MARLKSIAVRFHPYEEAFIATAFAAAGTPNKPVSPHLRDLAIARCERLLRVRFKSWCREQADLVTARDQGGRAT